MIYFDNSATTQAWPEALETYNKVSQNIWGNPSSLHKFGNKSFQLLEQSRKQIAGLLKVKSDEIYFTSSGTEGDNWIIKGTAIEKRNYGKHLITSQIEHPAVMNSMKQLSNLGFEVTYLPVDENGRVDPSDLKQAIRSDTILVSIMAVNNEIGSIQPIQQIAEILDDYPKIHFHVDAVQGVAKDIWPQIFNPRVDFATFSGHKFHAPRGTGFIYAKRGRKLAPLLNGGGQEKNQRSGTENVPAIAAMAKSLRMSIDQEKHTSKVEQAIKEKIYDHVSKFDKIEVFSKSNSQFAPHILCFAIKGVRGETVVHAFEEHDIYISTTSACSSKDKRASGTLRAMRVADDIATSAIRISLGEENTLEEAEKFLNVFDLLYQDFDKLS